MHRSLAVASLVAGLLTFAALGALARPSAPAASAAGDLVYFGTYTEGKSRGIYVSRFDAATGALAKPELAAESVNPSFLVAHPSGRFLYAANEIDSFGGEAAGAASGFAVDKATGKLTLLNQSSSRGTGPCYVSLDRAARHLFIANYGGGNVAVIPVGADGKLGSASSFVQHQDAGVDAPKRRTPHAHSLDLDPAGRFALAADLGLDRVQVYRFDAEKGALLPAEPPFAAVKAGSGPRHLAFRPDGRFAYVINELSMTLTAFRWDAEKGALTEVATISSLPPGVGVASGFSGAEVVAHPSGRFVYASNRGHDTIAVFALDAASGAPRLVENVPTGGQIPRGFNLDPAGRFLLVGNQQSDTVVVFAIDPASGRLKATGHSVEVGAPVSVVFVPAAGAR
jgi:6-phosphogluconolactonase